MHLTFRNVNDAFRDLISSIHSGKIAVEVRPSRVGKVLVIRDPVLITYERPRERVLFNIARDCNPFFHLYEALWMLAGRNDVASVAAYNNRMFEFSDNGQILNGAYGYRWRRHSKRSNDDVYRHGVIDQLDLLVEHLRANPHSRRAVLQMWNVEDDLLKIETPENCSGSKDVCCNTCVYFAIIEEEHNKNRVRRLEMTVCNRSNDLIWGLLGANYVHFTFLQEYLALRLGVQIGRYHHFTNNLHAYINNWNPEEWLKEYASKPTDPYLNGIQVTYDLVKDHSVFDRELQQFVERFSKSQDSKASWSEPFLETVAQPMLMAYWAYKNRFYNTMMLWLSRISAYDWKIASCNWINLRIKRKSLGISSITPSTCTQ